jgi:signal transduction histidine kinase
VVELRALANGLHPAVLEDGGLSAALEELATRLPVAVFVSEPARRYSPVVESAAWFTACEAISNAVKHAAPNHIVVHLDNLGDELVLVVDDDGCGGADPGGNGLRGLADRVEAAGGRLAVRAGAHGGTHVEAVLPCEL